MAEMLPLSLGCILLIPLTLDTMRAAQGTTDMFYIPLGWLPWVKDGQKQDQYHINE